MAGSSLLSFEINVSGAGDRVIPRCRVTSHHNVSRTRYMGATTLTAVVIWASISPEPATNRFPPVRAMSSLASTSPDLDTLAFRISTWPNEKISPEPGSLGRDSAAGRVDQSGHCHCLADAAQARRYPRQNSLVVALRELGRIERTLFILDRLVAKCGVAQRRTCQVEQGRGAQRPGQGGYSSTISARSGIGAASNNATGPAASTW
jgi:hypothetical protein